MQEVNQVRSTLATRFYTLLLQPRRRIYLIQDSFCLTGYRTPLRHQSDGVIPMTLRVRNSRTVYAGFGFKPIWRRSFSRFAASLPARSASSPSSMLSTWITRIFIISFHTKAKKRQLGRRLTSQLGNVLAGLRELVQCVACP